LDIQLDEGERGVLSVFVEDLGKEEIETFNLGAIGQPSDDDDGELGLFWIIVGALLLLIAVVFVVVVMMYSRGTSESDARIDRVGKYRYGRAPEPLSGRTAKPVPGRALSPTSRAPRRATPPPFRPPASGPRKR
jgi:hypothetical protein